MQCYFKNKSFIFCLLVLYFYIKELQTHTYTHIINLNQVLVGWFLIEFSLYIFLCKKAFILKQSYKIVGGTVQTTFS